MEETHKGEGIMANELACLNCGMGFTPTCHITRQKCSSSECRVRYNNAKRYCTDTPVNECPEYGTPIQQSGEAGRWRQCEKEEACVPMKKSTVPPVLLPGSGIVSASLLAQIMNSKYVLALPLYRQEQELRRLGLPVSRQSMSNWVLTAGERWLLPVYHALHKELLANEILHADETTLMVLREPERQALADELGEGGIQELAQRYAEAYEGCYDGAELDAYIEEICADAYAGMDRLPEAKTQIIQKAAQRAQGAQQTAEENGETRGTLERYSAGEDEGAVELYQGIDLSKDGRVYTYDFLTALPDMNVTVLPEVNEVRGKDGRVDTAEVVREGMKNARAVGTERDGKAFVQNAYTGRELRIDTASIRHGLNGSLNRLLTNARLGAAIGDVVKNAVPINALQNKADGVSGTYAMAAYATDNRGREFVSIVTVEQRSGDIASLEAYDVTHSVSGRQNKGSERVDTKSQGVNPSTNASNIKISDFLNVVKNTHQSVLSQNVLDEIGEERNPAGYYTGKAKFSADDTTATPQENDKAALTEVSNAPSVSQFRYSVAEDVSEASGTTAFTLDSIPKKAQDYLRRVRGQTAAAIQQTLSMPFAARQEVLKPAIEEMMNEYLQTGRISQETVDRSFEESYRRGVKRPTVRVRWEFSDTP